MHSRRWSERFIHRWAGRGLWAGLSMLLAWTTLGTVGFMFIEGWTLTDALYMSIITLSTVGFGEIHPLSPHGRLLASFLIVGGLGAAIYTLTRLGQVVLEGELLGGFGRRHMRKELSKLREHYIVCGFGRFSKPVVEGLEHQKLPFCIIESDPTLEPTLQDLGYLHLIDDATSDESLESVGVARAKAVLTLLPSDADNLYVTVTAKALNPNVFVIARAGADRGEQKLRRGGADAVISPYELASHRILHAATSPTVRHFLERVYDRRDLEMNFGESRISERSKLAGCSIGEARLRHDYGVIVVAIQRLGQAMLFNPTPEDRLEVDDVLVLMGNEQDLLDTRRALES